MSAPRQVNLRRLALALDAVLVTLSMFLASELHSGLRAVLPFLQDPPSFQHYAVLPFLTLPLFLALIAVFGLHRTFERAWRPMELLLDLAKLHGVAFLALAMLVFLTSAVINRSLLLGFLLSSFTLLYLERAVLGRWKRYQHESGQGRTRILLVGAPSVEMATFVAAARAQPLPPQLLGRVGVGNEESASNPSLPPRLGDVASLDALLHEEAVEQVLFFPPLQTPGKATPALQRCEALGITTGFVVTLPQPFGTPPRMATMFGQTFITFELAPKPPEALALKHGVDALLALVLLVLLSPLLALVSAAIWVTMGRPIFFSQERAGLYGRKFRMLKFRTMVTDAEQRKAQVAALNEMSGPVFKVTNDPRVTPLGRWLRLSSIDELPQLFHVLLGTMSLVGPRPLPRTEQQQILGWHRRRLTMKPGITGLWQVAGRNDIDFEEWMKLDLTYVDRWSLWLDLKILLRTLPTVLRGRGAR